MSGLGSFIQGAFKGYEYGENIKDRKTQRKRDEKRWEWEKENRDWQREQRDWQRENNEWATEQRNRKREQWERAEQERDVLSGIHENARESYDEEPAQPGAPPSGQVSSRGSGDAPPARGVIDPPEGNVRPKMRPRSVAPQPSVSSEGPQQPPRPDQPSPAPTAPDPREDTPPAMRQPEQTMRPGRSVQGAAGTPATGSDAPMPRSFAEHPRAQQAAEQAGIPIEDIWSRMKPEGQRTFIEMDRGGPQQTPTPPQTRPQTDPSGRPQQGVRRPEPPAGTAPRTVTQGRGRDEVQAPQSPPAPERPAAERPGPGQDARQTPARAGPAEAPSKGGNVDVREASTAELDARATQNPPDQGGAPSVESASTAVQETAQASRGVVGKGTGKVNPEDEERASQTFMQHYAETAVPKIIDYYLSQGNIEKATAFQEWADSQEVKGQLKSWSKAIFAADVGDEGRFFDHAEDYYNAIDDGYSLKRDQSGFQRDDQGNITGATLAIRNDETGEINEVNFDDQEDLVKTMVYAHPPEQLFEYLWGLSEQAREMRIKAETGQAGGIEPLDLAKEIRREADSIRSSQEFAAADTRMSDEQIEQIARQNVYRRLGMAAGGSTGQDVATERKEPARLE